MNAIEQAQIGTSDEADFEKGTWTFAMQPGFEVSAGRFAILPESALAALSAPAQKPDFSKCATFEEYRALSSAAGQEPCGACNGTGWMTRDPDIGTDQECFACDGSGRSSESRAQEPVAYMVTKKRWQETEGPNYFLLIFADAMREPAFEEDRFDVEIPLYADPTKPQEQPVAAQQDDGYCRSCAGDKCTTGPECVALGRDSVPAQAPQQEASAPAQAAEGLGNALQRLERAVDLHLGRSSWTQTTHLKGYGYSEAVRKELFAAHDEARAALAASHPQAAQQNGGE